MHEKRLNVCLCQLISVRTGHNAKFKCENAEKLHAKISSSVWGDLHEHMYLILSKYFLNIPHLVSCALTFSLRLGEDWSRYLGHTVDIEEDWPSGLKWTPAPSLPVIFVVVLHATVLRGLRQVWSNRTWLSCKTLNA